jgi:acetylornithine/N-succinyldiaminopimelate aminotransferase
MYSPLMLNYRFVPYNDSKALEHSITKNIVAVILELIQGEGGFLCRRTVPDKGRQPL